MCLREKKREKERNKEKRRESKGEEAVEGENFNSSSSLVILQFQHSLIRRPLRREHSIYYLPLFFRQQPAFLVLLPLLPETNILHYYSDERQRQRQRHEHSKLNSLFIHLDLDLKPTRRKQNGGFLGPPHNSLP